MNVRTLDQRLDDQKPDGDELLGNVLTLLRTFVVYPNEHAAHAHALWIAHAHLMHCWDSTPRLAFLSPVPESGKTRAVEITGLMVPNARDVVNATAAYLFRAVGSGENLPTLLLDEADTVFDPAVKAFEDIRGFVNTGHRKSGKYGRCVVRGRSIETEEFSAYCAVALAGLGWLPDTIISRSIVIRMKRRAPGESVEPYRHRIHSAAGYRLRDQLAAWAAAVGGDVKFPSTMPPGVEDRQADCWESLLAVADLVGGPWPAWARAAAVAFAEESRARPPTLAEQLLADVRTAFGDRLAMFTQNLLTALNAMEESPWGELNKGAGLTDRQLAKRLKPFGVKPGTVREGSATNKGYKREQLDDPWSRYLPPTNTIGANGAGLHANAPPVL